MTNVIWDWIFIIWFAFRSCSKKWMYRVYSFRINSVSTFIRTKMSSNEANDKEYLYLLTKMYVRIRKIMYWRKIILRRRYVYQWYNLRTYADQIMISIDEYVSSILSIIFSTYIIIFDWSIYRSIYISHLIYVRTYIISLISSIDTINRCQLSFVCTSTYYECSNIIIIGNISTIGNDIIENCVDTMGYNCIITEIIGH